MTSGYIYESHQQTYMQYHIFMHGTEFQDWQQCYLLQITFSQSIVAKQHRAQFQKPFIHTDYNIYFTFMHGKVPHYGNLQTINELTGLIISLNQFILQFSTFIDIIDILCLYSGSQISSCLRISIRFVGLYTDKAPIKILYKVLLTNDLVYTTYAKFINNSIGPPLMP